MSGDPRPTDLHLERDSKLTVRWADGVTTVIPLTTLRAACPCATCRAYREEREANPLAVVRPADTSQQAVAERAELVGRYALKVVWKDGHDTGIYDFALLRRLGGTGNGS